MSSLALKLAAMASMLVDHVGVHFYSRMPQSLYVLCRATGRIAMPVFCFLIAEGLFHTRDARKYLLRLAAFAVVSEIPYDLFLSGNIADWGMQNVGFTLLLGLLGILLFDSFAATGRKTAALLAAIAAALAAVCINSDYTCYGVYYIFIFYRFRGNFRPLAAAFAAGVLCMAAYIFMSDGWGFAVTSLAAFGALIPIMAYSGEKGRGGVCAKWLLYAFYPAHLLALWLM